MSDLRKLRNKGVCRILEYSARYRYSGQLGIDYLIQTSGVLNCVWNNWNNFWREFWISFVTGGKDFEGHRLTAIFPNYSDYQACHYLLYLCGKRNRHNIGDAITFSYQEATWGDASIIETLALNLQAHQPYMTILSGIISNYKNEIKHFQQIRNAFIHLNNASVISLNQLQANYIFKPPQSGLDILETRTLASGEKCYSFLVNNLRGMLLAL